MLGSLRVPDLAVPLRQRARGARVPARHRVVPAVQHSYRTQALVCRLSQRLSGPLVYFNHWLRVELPPYFDWGPTLPDGKAFCWICTVASVPVVGRGGGVRRCARAARQAGGTQRAQRAARSARTAQAQPARRRALAARAALHRQRWNDLVSTEEFNLELRTFEQIPL